MVNLIPSSPAWWYASSLIQLAGPVVDLFPSRCACTLIRLIPRASAVYTTTFLKTPIAHSRAVCASPTCGTHPPSQTGARLTRRRTSGGPCPDAAYLPGSGGGATFSSRYNPSHRWYCLRGQSPDDVTLIKCFDSNESKARLTTHTVFLNSMSPRDATDRQSIEVCCLVFDEE